LDERLTTLKLTEQQDFLQPYVQQVRLGVFSTCVTSMVYLPVQFIDRTFEMTKPNLRINGRTVEEDGTEGTFGEGGSVVPSPFCLSDVSLELEVEPFDEALDRHIWSLSDQRLKWDRELANKRRTRPQEVVTMIQDILSLRQQVDDQIATPSIDDDSEMTAEQSNDGKVTPTFIILLRC